MNRNKQNKPTMLIVEDDHASQELFKILLGRSYDLSICDGEKEFFAFIEQRSADIVLMDISLNGEKNGIELIEYLRKNELEYQHTPVICYSAHAFSKDKANALNAGADIFIAKPARNEVLIEAIESMLKKGSS